MQECIAIFARAGPNDSPSCDIYIGVFAYPSSATNLTTFSILATTNSTRGDRGSLLTDGTPQQGVVARTQYTYYYATVSVPANSSYFVAITPSSGDPDL